MNKYSIKEKEYQLILPLSTEILIPADSSVRLLSRVLESLDFSKERVLYEKRQRAIPFVILLKVVVYGFMRNIRSSRGIEAACRENINFMWLLEWHRVPDHNMIARFINAVDINNILVKVNNYLIECGEINFEYGFVDGTKFEANANRYTFVWKGAIEKHRARLLPKLEAFLVEVRTRYALRFCGIADVVNYLEYMDIKQVFGKGARKSQEQKDLELANAYFTKLSKYDYYLKTIGESRKSMSKTDKDATFMRLKDDHMRNGQLKAAYNIQLCVESEYIVSTLVSSERSDQLTLIPLLDKVHSEYQKRHEIVSGDAGFESEENYSYLKVNQQKAFIKPQNYEQQKTRKYKQQIGRKENMLYNENTDTFTCANNKTLSAVFDKIDKSVSGYKRTVTVYQCESCSDCSVRKQCTQAKDGNNKRIQMSKAFEKFRKQSFDNITSELGIQIRVNRSIQAEGAFGIIKQDYGFRRLNRRTQKNVEKEINLIAIAFNINKLHSNILNNRLNFALHTLAKN
jgi:transposase